MTSGKSDTFADRARLARELHDGIAQDLVGVGYSLDLLLANPETTLGARCQLRTLRFTITELIDKVRREIYVLRQPSTFALAEEIKNSAETICTGMELIIDFGEMTGVIDSELSYEIHRIVQEVLRNIAIHAQAQVVTISCVSTKDAFEMCISDDGIGGAVVSDSRFGIRGILDRAAQVNATVNIVSDSQGTHVSLRVPLEEHARQ